ncbi:hypothetical protein AZI87_01250 [Bdellovibrio bacteriovorus]|uniref:Uncharacterized protein n=1 Tax=Bdellovibrio bacteriovorus TaxID=959 RepID=A0A162GE35_BDEBC|nr:hypothetical protein [Bdellovibrio bacteriovorus]KYG67930.1 hypothetical protein AZI87_01250 [Bdellovibrio bacteriovorus]
MKPITLKVWILWALVLFILGVLADYYFLHILFHEKQNGNGTHIEAMGTPAETPAAQPTPETGVDSSFLDRNASDESANSLPQQDNFLASLKACAPEIAAQAIATPEALLEYLQKSVGVAREEIAVENYHLTLKDGTLRRVHVIAADNTNSADKKEIRYFKLDAEGYPERLPLKSDETVESLLAQGTVTKHEVKSKLDLKDGSSVSLEMHDQRAFEFQYDNHGKVLSCRLRACQCP